MKCNKKKVALSFVKMDAVITVIVLQKQRNEWNVTNYKLCIYAPILSYIMSYSIYYLFIIRSLKTNL